MPAKSIDPLVKVTVDLYKIDVKYLKDLDVNFSEVLRKLLHDHVTMIKAAEHRVTLGDLGESKFHIEKDGTKVYHSSKDYRND